MKTPELEIAEEAAQRADAITTQYFRDAGDVCRSKDIANLVSDADVEAEHAIVAVIKRAYPGHEVLGEETHHGDAAAAQLVVDPLDGTNNFHHRIPHFAVSIAYWHEGKPEMGLIYNPILDDWYRAVRGRRAYYGRAERWWARAGHARRGARRRRLLLRPGCHDGVDPGLDPGPGSAASDPRGIRRCGTAPLRPLQGRPRNLRCVGFEYALSPWDFAAPRPCFVARPAVASPPPAAARCHRPAPASSPRTACSTSLSSKSSAPITRVGREEG